MLNLYQKNIESARAAEFKPTHRHRMFRYEVNAVVATDKTRVTSRDGSAAVVDTSKFDLLYDPIQ